MGDVSVRSKVRSTVRTIITKVHNATCGLQAPYEYKEGEVLVETMDFYKEDENLVLCGAGSYTRKSFIEKVAPIVQKDNSGVLHSLTIAQAILESGDGNSLLTRQGNALFGIKPGASWKGRVWTGCTVEYYDGTKTSINCGFRAYDSWEESIKDHSNLLTSLSRYSKVVGEKDYKKACRAIQAAGYATDPNYADKLISLIEANNLTQYDKAPIKDDKELSDAVSKIIKAGYRITHKNWKRMDLFEQVNVPILIGRLGGLEAINNKIVEAGMEFDLNSWVKAMKTNTFKNENVRSLIIKFSKAI